MIDVIIIATIVKVYKNHNASLLLVTTKKIEESAEKCYLEEKCKDGNTTLGFLISENYIDPQIHPITKEQLDENLEIICSNYECTTNIN